MNHRMGLSILASVAVLLLGGGTRGQAQQTEMSFFLTSTGPGKGGDPRGLSRADQPCHLAGGARGRRWSAIMTDRACATTMRRSPGTRRIPHADRMGAAVRTI